MKVRLGTRGSRLALAQAELAAAALRRAGCETEIVVVRTRGDERTDMSLSELGRGAFTDIFREKLARGELDVAVHSAKDLPTDEGHDGFFCLPRADARDVLLSLPGREVLRVGTGSPRRAAFAASRFPAAQVLPVRGNVDTRLKKLRAGEFDALILAAAGLARLGAELSGLTAESLPPALCVPAACQGIIAVEGACGALVNDEEASQASRVERALQRALGGGCTGGVGAYFDGALLYAQKNGVIHTRPYAGEESILRLAEEFV